MRAAVEVRLEAEAALVDGAALTEGKRLVAPAVGEDRPVPADEPVQASEAGDPLVARPEIEVVCVREHDLGASLDEIARENRFDCALRADGHEGRRLHDPVRRHHRSASRAMVGRGDAKSESRSHCDIV